MLKADAPRIPPPPPSPQKSRKSQGRRCSRRFGKQGSYCILRGERCNTRGGAAVTHAYAATNKQAIAIFNISASKRKACSAIGKDGWIFFVI